VSEVDPLMRSLLGDDEWSRHQALERLRAEGAPSEVVEELVTGLSGDDAGRRAAARMALAALADLSSPVSDQAAEALVAALGSRDPDLRVLAASAMGESGNRRLATPLLAALDESEPNVVAAVADALGELGVVAAVEPLGRLAGHATHWVAAAAVVALGRLRDARAVPSLEAAATKPGLERLVAEAVGRIDDPTGLAVLEIVRESAPREGLGAAGSILSSHPDVAPPPWVVADARSGEEGLRARLEEVDDPAVARLLGIAATPAAVETLVRLALPPRRSEAALNGLLVVPPDERTDPLLDRMETVDAEDQVLLLSLLPPLTDAAHIDRLVPLLAHPHGRVRGAAAEAIGRSPGGGDRLARELGRDDVRPEVVRASGWLGPRACAALTPLLRDEDAEIRAAAAQALGRCAEPGVANVIEEAASDEADPRVCRALYRALGRIGGDAAVRVLHEALDDEDPETRVTVIEALGATRSPHAIPHLDRMLAGSAAESLAAIGALGDIPDPGAVSLIEPFLRSPDVERRRAAASAVLPASETLSMEALEVLGHDSDPWVRGVAARMLGQHGEAARAVLERIAARDSDPAVRAQARRALDREG
jgi:cellulose synthase operon protein C